MIRKGSVMKKQSIAIVGLGKVGAAFLQELLGQLNEGVEIIAVAENNNTPGLALAKARGIKNISMDELIGMGDSLDIIFELTSVAAVRQELRDKLQAAGNHQTIIATENIARMIWMLISSGAEMPGAHVKTGYDV
jgi:predicted dinucleotide-utilizing enzyme